MGPARYIFLTGATGLVGRALLTDLLKARLPVAVFVRPGRECDASLRIETLMQRCEQQFRRQLPRPIVINGELTEPGLGISSSDRRWLQRHCSSVLHSAAYLSFKPADEHADNEPFRTNVEGTRRLAEFCGELGIDELHHVSSAFACGQRSGRVLESERDVGQSYSNDYESSKCQAEVLLAGDRSLKSLTVYRPSIVIDPTPGSLITGDRTIYLAFTVYQMLSKRMGLVRPEDVLRLLSLTGNERKNIVPVEWVSQTLVQILRRPQWHRRTYHLTHPQGTRMRDLLEAFHGVLAEQGYPQLTPQGSKLQLGELAGVVNQFVHTFTPYFRDDPVFDQTQLLQALAACGGENCPEIDQPMLQELARQQLRPTALPGESTVTPADAVWTQLQQELNSGRTCDAGASLAPFGLKLSGAHGGDWLLGLSAQGELVSQPREAVSATRKIYTTTQTWGQLLRRQMDWGEACQQGRVLLETAAESGDTGIEIDAKHLLEMLTERVSQPGPERKVRLHGN